MLNTAESLRNLQHKYCCSPAPFAPLVGRRDCSLAAGKLCGTATSVQPAANSMMSVRSLDRMHRNAHHRGGSRLPEKSTGANTARKAVDGNIKAPACTAERGHKRHKERYPRPKDRDNSTSQALNGWCARRGIDARCNATATTGAIQQTRSVRGPPLPLNSPHDGSMRNI